MVTARPLIQTRRPITPTITGEAPQPQGVADHDRPARLAAARILAGEKHPADDRPHAEHVEVIGAGQHAPQRFCQTRLGGRLGAQREPTNVERGDTRQRSRPRAGLGVANLFVVGVGEIGLPVRRGHLQRHEPLDALHRRQRLKDDALQPRVGGAGGADAEAEAENDRDGDNHRRAQAAQRETQVVDEIPERLHQRREFSVLSFQLRCYGLFGL